MVPTPPHRCCPIFPQGGGGGGSGFGSWGGGGGGGGGFGRWLGIPAALAEGEDEGGEEGEEVEYEEVSDDENAGEEVRWLRCSGPGRRPLSGGALAYAIHQRLQLVICAS